MNTLLRFASQSPSVSAPTVWYLTELAEARGRQELFARQSPQKLKVLREHALIESAISSNRMEGVEIDPARVGTVVFGRMPPRDRSEEEVRGYRSALKEIHEQTPALPVSQDTIRRLHKLSRSDIWDAGQYKAKDADIIEPLPDGRQRVRFRTLPAAKTPGAMAELVALWDDCLRERWVYPLVGLAAFNLDFLCVHPFRDGNGRVSRLLLLLQLYHLGFEVGRYISLERLIEDNKERYYETLEESSRGWHEGQHDPWPYVNFLLFVLAGAYREFEERVGRIASPRGAKQELVLEAIRGRPDEFRLVDLERACPGVSREWIRILLARLRRCRQVACRGRGPAARWRYLATRRPRGTKPGQRRRRAPGARPTAD